MISKKLLVKIGGEVADNKETAMTLLDDLINLKSQGWQVVLCHGGGPQITKELKSRGVEARFIQGQRVTDESTLAVTIKVLLGEINASLVAMCNRNSFHAVGLSGLDAGLYQAVQRDASLGYVGDVKNVNIEYITNILENNYIPIVASIGIGADGQVFNINADSAAGELAKALRVEQYLVFTNVEGLYRSFPDKNSLIRNTDLNEIIELKRQGILTEGMIPKIDSIICALKGGVEKAVIVDGRKEHAILNTVLDLEQNKEIYGTLIAKG